MGVRFIGRLNPTGAINAAGITVNDGNGALTLSGMTDTKYNGVYSYVKNGYLSGSTYYLDTDDQAIYSAPAGGGDFYVIYSNDSTGFYVDQFDSDPSTWVNGNTYSRDSGSSSEYVSGYAPKIDGVYYPDDGSSKVSYS